MKWNWIARALVGAWYVVQLLNPVAWVGHVERCRRKVVHVQVGDDEDDGGMISPEDAADMLVDLSDEEGGTDAR